MKWNIALRSAILATVLGLCAVQAQSATEQNPFQLYTTNSCATQSGICSVSFSIAEETAIHFIGCTYSVAPGSQVAAASVTFFQPSGPPIAIELPISFTGIQPQNSVLNVASNLQTLLYPNPGTPLFVEVTMASNATIFNLNCMISGYSKAK